MYILSDLPGKSDEVLLHGTEAALPKPLSLQCGPFSMNYENGNLRYIRLDGQEVIRMIYPAVRNSSWGTVLPIITDEQINQEKDSFSVTYQAEYVQEPVNYKAAVEIVGEKSGRIIFRFSGEAKSTFLKNRIGLCVLHPMECAGKSVQIIHPDGRKETQVFPKLVAPHQPFMDVQGMIWNPADGLEVSVDFTGEVFETEDQRNWTDASFKTYSTPLAVPYPAKVSAGELLEQSVCVQALKFSEKTSTPDNCIQININKDLRSHLPAIGISKSRSANKLTDEELKFLRKLGLDHYRVELHFGSPDWELQFSEGNSEAKKMGLPLLMALTFSDSPIDEAKSFIEKCFDIFPQIEEIMLFSEKKEATPHLLFDEVEALLREGLHHARIGVGTQDNFAEFNRNGTYPGKADFLVFSVNPQVHAFDNSTLVENLLSFSSLVKTAIHNEGNRPVYFSPVTLLPVQHHNVNRNERPQGDHRQFTLFGAGWMIAAIKYLAEADVHSVSLFETSGANGILDNASGLHVSPACLYLASILEKREFVLHAVSSEPCSVNALVATAGSNLKIYIVNHTAEAKKVRLNGISGAAQLSAAALPDIRSGMSKPEEFYQLTKKELIIGSESIVKIEPFSIGVLELNEQI